MRPLTRTTHLVSLATAAHFLAISTSTVRRRIAEGTITGYRIGRRIRVDLDEVIGRLPVPIPLTRTARGRHGRFVAAHARPVPGTPIGSD